MSLKSTCTVKSCGDAASVNATLYVEPTFRHGCFKSSIIGGVVRDVDDGRSNLRFGPLYEKRFVDDSLDLGWTAGGDCGVGAEDAASAGLVWWKPALIWCGPIGDFGVSDEDTASNLVWWNPSLVWCGPTGDFGVGDEDTASDF